MTPNEPYPRKELPSPPSVPSKRTRKAPVPDADVLLNQAIEKHLAFVWDKKIEQRIIDLVGAAGLARIKEIDAFANRAEIWTSQSHDQAYAQTQRELPRRYPFLSPAAQERLATRAAWSWR